MAAATGVANTSEGKLSDFFLAWFQDRIVELQRFLSGGTKSITFCAFDPSFQINSKRLNAIMQFLRASKHDFLLLSKTWTPAQQAFLCKWAETAKDDNCFNFLTPVAIWAFSSGIPLSIAFTKDSEFIATDEHRRFDRLIQEQMEKFQKAI
jgi:hypothetical protein